MQVLIIQEAGRHEENKNFRECLSLKRAFNYHDITADVWGLGHDNYHIQPYWDDYDLIINLENYDETGWVPNLCGVKATKFLWAIDAHVKGINNYLATAKAGNYNLILQASPQFVNFGASTWFPNCYDDDLIVPKDVEKDKLYDVGFCGNVCNRANLINALKNGFDSFKFDEFVIGDSMVNAINSYKIHWNCNISVDINYRNFETMGCQTLLLTSYHPAYESLGIQHEKNCLIYRDEKEMFAMAHHILKHDDFRLQMAEYGYKMVKKNHTYKKRVEQIMEIYDAVK